MAVSPTHDTESPVRHLPRPALLLACVVVALLANACGAPAQDAREPTSTGAGMAGPTVEVAVTQAAMDSRPDATVLTDPEAAVRTYLAWTSYAYRIGQSQVALPTMTPNQEVRVDSYLQYNLQQARLLDQGLVTITFGTALLEDGRALVPAREWWRYQYVSATDAGVVVGGPYEASYDTTYTVVRNAEGQWLVDEVEAVSQGPVQ